MLASVEPTVFCPVIDPSLSPETFLFLSVVAQATFESISDLTFEDSFFWDV